MNSKCAVIDHNMKDAAISLSRDDSGEIYLDWLKQAINLFNPNDETKLEILKEAGRINGEDIRAIVKSGVWNT